MTNATLCRVTRLFDYAAPRDGEAHNTPDRTMFTAVAQKRCTDCSALTGNRISPRPNQWARAPASQYV